MVQFFVGSNYCEVTCYLNDNQEDVDEGLGCFPKGMARMRVYNSSIHLQPTYDCSHQLVYDHDCSIPRERYRYIIGI